jgi:hypothetical protein
MCVLPPTYGGFLLLLFPAAAHQGHSALGARGHRLLRVSDHVHTRSGAVFLAETKSMFAAILEAVEIPPAPHSPPRRGLGQRAEGG